MKELYIILTLTLAISFNGKGQGLDSVYQEMEEIDSLLIRKDSLSGKIDSLKSGKFFSTLDSIQHIQVPTNPLDTIKLPSPGVDTLLQKVKNLEQRVQAADSLNILKDIPIGSFDGLEVPEVLEDVDSDLGSKTPALDKPALPKPETPGFIEEGKAFKEDVNENFAGLKDKGDAVTGELEAIQSDSTYIDRKAEELAKKQLEEYAEMDELAEKSAMSEGFFEEQFKKEQYLKQLNEAKGKASADWITKKAGNIAFDKMEVHQEKVDKATEKLDKAKKKYGEFENMEAMKNIKRFRLDLPFRKRLYPDIVFQLQKESITGIYLSPSVGYRVNRIIKAGAGYSYRINLDNDFKYLSFRRDIYGPKAFLQVKAFKSFSVRGEYEYLRTSVPSGSSNDFLTREWVSLANFGIVKDISFKGNVTGQVQLLYNVIYDEHRTPFTKPLMMRIAIGLNSFQKVKKPKFRKELDDKLRLIEEEGKSEVDKL